MRIPIHLKTLLLISYLMFFKVNLFSQVECVEIDNYVYEFLDRMNIKRIINGYSNNSLPLLRKEIVEFIVQLQKNKNLLNEVELGILKDLETEFCFELSHSDSMTTLFFGGNTNVVEGLNDIFSDNEKFIYLWNDDQNSFFLEGLLSADFRFKQDRINTSLYTWGGRLRGNIGDNLGYYMLATNGQVFGNKDFAITDPILKGNYKINEPNASNFDFTEGYVSYATSLINLRIGRERISLGNGYIDKLLISPELTAYDLIQGSTSIGSVHYTFLHSWLLNKENVILSDQSRVINSKYLAAHRFEVSLFSGTVDLGFSEMIVYSNRSPELVYLTPLIFFKSVEHSLRDRDNALMSFDFSSKFFNNMQIYGTFLIDDIDFSKLGTKWWGNLFIYQGGIKIVEPLNLSNFDIGLEYTRIQPYTYTHRFNDNNYTNSIYPIGPYMQPNSDKISFSTKYFFTHRLNTSITYSFERHGANVTDANGGIIKNVGGDIEMGHRSIDENEVTFLDGIYEEKNTVLIMLFCEPFNEIFLNVRYKYITLNSDSKRVSDKLFGIQIKLNY